MDNNNLYVAYTGNGATLVGLESMSLRQRQCLGWMEASAWEFVDDVGECSATELGEAAAREFDLADDRGNLPDWVWEMAMFVSDEEESNG